MLYKKVTIGKKFETIGGAFSYSDENSRSKPIGLSSDFYPVIVDGLLFSGVTPRQGEELSFLELDIDPVYFSPIAGTAFNCVACETAAYKIFGWIDGVDVLSDSGKNTRIAWHVDWFLTCQANGTLEFGEGKFKRYDLAHARPDPSNPRYWKTTNVTSIDHFVSTGGVMMQGPWAVMLYIDKSGSETVFKTAAFCVREAGGTAGGKSSGIEFEFPEIYSGKCDEQMGLDPDRIIGCWISPIFPGSGNNFTLKTFTYGAQNFGWFESSSNVTKWWGVITGLENWYTDDSRKICIVDPYDAVYATLPWGLKTSELYAKLDISTEGANLLIYLKPIDDTDKIYAENRLISIPLISAAITSNAWSSYVYSGQREYDRITAKYQREQSLLSGVLGSGTSAIGGALAGSTVGMTGVGAAAGAAMNIVGSVGNFFVSGHYDDKTQSAVDKLTANTAASCVVTGSGNAWTTKLGETAASGETWKLVMMERDPVSKAELEAEHAELGYVTDFYCADCSALIAAGGPMRIEGLKCKGISKEAQAYISAIFANGVKLDVVNGE